MNERKDNLIASDATIRNAKAKDKPYRVKDAKGFYLLINIDSSKWWRLDYAINDKRKTLSLGVYPAIGLSEAREKFKDAQALIKQGIDPSDIRKVAKAEKAAAIDMKNRIDAGFPIKDSFKDAALTWLGSIAHTVQPVTHEKKTTRFELHVFPLIGNKPIKEIKSHEVFSVLQPLIDKMQLETAHRIHAEISSVFCYAIAHAKNGKYGGIDYDPAQAVAKQIPAQKVKHRAALTEPREVAQLLRNIYSYQGTFVVQCALRLSPLLFQRPGEIRQMEWKDVDLVAKEWRYFVTKTEVLHIVPLSAQAITILEEIKQLTGTGRYVFPSIRGNGRPMSNGTIIAALKTLGYSSDVMTAHGFRTTASTLLNEQGWSPDAIERQLCHMPKDEVRAAYNRAQYLQERRRMMQSWGDYLDSLKNGAVIIPLSKTAN